MLRDDLAKAREKWLKETKDDPQEYAQRQQSDFLADVNHEGEITDFHSLRHTCGAWLAMTGAHPKVVQQVMRQTLNVILDYLEEKGMIMIGKKGVLWIHNDSVKMKKLLENSIEV